MKEAMLEISIKLNISMQEFLMGLVLAVGAPNADAPELHWAEERLDSFQNVLQLLLKLH